MVRYKICLSEKERLQQEIFGRPLERPRSGPQRKKVGRPEQVKPRPAFEIPRGFQGDPHPGSFDIIISSLRPSGIGNRPRVKISKGSRQG
jgi:hypothetical protein